MAAALHPVTSESEGLAPGAGGVVDKALVVVEPTAAMERGAPCSRCRVGRAYGYGSIYRSYQRCTLRPRIPLLGSKIIHWQMIVDF